MKVMISLIGEQPIPNLLPIKSENPDQVVLVYTERTERISRRLEEAIDKVESIIPYQVEAYDVPGIMECLRRLINEKGWASSSVTFNLTGGTKLMVIGAYEVAKELGSPIVYLVSEKDRPKLYRFTTTGGKLSLVPGSPQELQELITLDEYLKIHIGRYKEGGFDHPFVEEVFRALKPHVQEIKSGVKPSGVEDIDLAMRLGNRVGIAEVKTGRKVKKGIDQLTTAGAREYLGTYTKRFLITDCIITQPDLRNLAQGHSITLIELPSAQEGELSKEDRKKLVDTVLGELGGGKCSPAL